MFYSEVARSDLLEHQLSLVQLYCRSVWAQEVSPVIFILKSQVWSVLSYKNRLTLLFVKVKIQWLPKLDVLSWSDEIRTFQNIMFHSFNYTAEVYEPRKYARKIM